MERTAEGLQILRPAVAVFKDDAGAWELVELEEGHGYELNRILFTDERHGLAVTEISTFFTEDGGSQWSVSRFTGPCQGSVNVTSDPQSKITTVHFLNSRTGWLAYEDGHFLRTSDGGQSWCTLSREWLEMDGLADKFVDFFFRSESQGWGLTTFGQLYETSDGGRIWRLVPSVERFRRLISPDHTTGWLTTDTSLYELIPPPD